MTEIEKKASRKALEDLLAKVGEARGKSMDKYMGKKPELATVEPGEDAAHEDAETPDEEKAETECPECNGAGCPECEPKEETFQMSPAEAEKLRKLVRDMM